MAAATRVAPREYTSEAQVGATSPDLREARESSSGAVKGGVNADMDARLVSWEGVVSDGTSSAEEKSANSGSYGNDSSPVLCWSVGMGRSRILCGLMSPWMIPASV